VATLLVNSGPDKRPKTNRVINWLAAALVKMKAIRVEEARLPGLINIEQVLDKIRIEGNSDELIDLLAKTIGEEYRYEEGRIKDWVYYREQVATLKVNYALARFENKNPSEAFEMLVFADEEEDPLILSATAKKPRHERILTEPQIYHTRNQLLMRAICDPVKTILMKTNQESVGRLTLFNIQHSIGHSTRGTVLILPNAYGILPYLEPLASELAENGWDTFWFAFSGQRNGGELSLASAVSDLSVIIDRLKSIGSKPLSLIAHGAGALAILEYLKSDPQRCEDLNTLIITGMLFNVQRVLNSDINEIEKYNVCARLDSEETEYDPATALQAIKIPVLFCHAIDKRHLLRATEQEMNTAVNLTPNASIRWFARRIH
jgi:alpha-beta hydrolase superfamily lysophospholipase